MNGWLIVAILIYLYAGIYDVYLERVSREDLYYPWGQQALTVLLWPLALPVLAWANWKGSKLYTTWSEDDDGTIYFDSESQQ